MRQNPRILSLHMSMAASYWRERFESGETDAQEVHAEFLDMMRGIHMYLGYEYERVDDHLKRVYQDGCVSIFSLKDHDYDAGRPSVFLLPSLVNKSHIFDLTETRSMLRYFCAQGIDAYLLDWGVFIDDPDMQDVESIVLRKLCAAVEFLNDEAGGPVHCLGYCMGGTLLAALAARRQELFRSCVYMAVPWDFHAGTQNLLNRVKFWWPSLQQAITSQNNVKVDWFQTLFASLFPAQAMHKFAAFSKMDMDSDDARIFVVVEDWLNDGVPFSAGLANDFITEWFLDNAPVCDAWVMDGNIVDLSCVSIPSFVVASSKDSLVEYEMSRPLYDGLLLRENNVQFLDPECGHVGMVAGKKSVPNVWAPIAQWIKTEC